MNRGRRPRIAIAVEPAILAEALAEVLRQAGVDDVVDLREHADVALVTVRMATAVDADIIVELPDDTSGTGPADVRIFGHSASVPVNSLQDVLRLLDDYCPGLGRRA